MVFPLIFNGFFSFFLLNTRARKHSELLQESWALQEHHSQTDPAAWGCFKAKVARRTFSSL